MPHYIRNISKNWKDRIQRKDELLEARPITITITQIIRYKPVVSDVRSGVYWT